MLIEMVVWQKQKLEKEKIRLEIKVEGLTPENSKLTREMVLIKSKNSEKQSEKQPKSKKY